MSSVSKVRAGLVDHGRREQAAVKDVLPFARVKQIIEHTASENRVETTKPAELEDIALQKLGSIRCLAIGILRVSHKATEESSLTT